MAYDNPIPGFGTRNCINLRLWAAKPSREFDLEAFNTGDYVQVRVLQCSAAQRSAAQCCAAQRSAVQRSAVQGQVAQAVRVP